MRISLKALFALVLFFLVPVFGAGAQSQEVPEDFEVVFTSRPVLVRQAIDIETLTIYSDGEVVLSPKVHFSGQFPELTREVLLESHLVLDADTVPESEEEEEGVAGMFKRALKGKFKRVREAEESEESSSDDDSDWGDGDW